MGKMAFGLRRDVQKASYYVWFLGAQEARGLRGSRILYPVIPRLIERAREQEPLKVTLQVSHKGLKIIQGSSKHFIPHSAITCSVQTDDIVACVLLLYNPATKCPLHVHAYRCDSETTAQALNQQLQILINRPENQKRFSELETRLGLTLPDGSQLSASSATAAPITVPPQEIPAPSQKVQLSKQHRSSSRNYESSSPPRRFDSSLGSDTGTSTRESECSEEHTPTSPHMPVSSPSAKANLYDSLAAELRAKLNGNGPPLLLPPRDYDTVHRSKGNLAAIELRRCRNISIVGGPGNKNKSGVVSSRGSSGIGSDLAPSPERQDGQTSSDDEWAIEQHHQEINASKRRSIPVPDEPVISTSKYNKNLVSSSYAAYPKDKPLPREESINKRYQRSSSREEDKSQRDSINSRDEDEVKPILNKIRPVYRDVFDDKKYNVESDKRYSATKYIDDNKISPAVVEDKRYAVEPSPRRYNSDMYRDDENTMYRRKSADRSGNFIERDVVDYRGEREQYRENLTDKQKYRESLAEKRINQIKYDERTMERSKDRMYREEVPQPIEKSHKYRDSSIEKSGGYTGKQKYDEYDKNRYNREKSLDRKKFVSSNGKQSIDDENEVQYRPRKTEEYRNNPYKQPESQPYHESIEKMLKSPVMRYKSIDDSRYIQQNENTEWVRGKEERKRFSSIDRYRDEASPQPPMPMQTHESRYHRGGGGGGGGDEPERMLSRQRKIKRDDESPPEIVKKVSPKDRFQDAKEKFQAMERERSRIQQEKAKLSRKSSMEPSRRGSIEPSVSRGGYSEKSHDGWSSDEEPIQVSSSRFRDMQINDRYSSNGGGGGGGGMEHDSSQSRVAPSKSLSNLVKGYRHSYAEPQRNPMPRGSGRVGLAAVNPY